MAPYRLLEHLVAKPRATKTSLVALSCWAINILQPEARCRNWLSPRILLSSLVPTALKSEPSLPAPKSYLTLRLKRSWLEVVHLPTISRRLLVVQTCGNITTAPVLLVLVAVLRAPALPPTNPLLERALPKRKLLLERVLPKRKLPLNRPRPLRGLAALLIAGRTIPR